MQTGRCILHDIEIHDFEWSLLRAARRLTEKIDDFLLRHPSVQQGKPFGSRRRGTAKNEQRKNQHELFSYDHHFAFAVGTGPPAFFAAAHLAFITAASLARPSGVNPPFLLGLFGMTSAPDFPGARPPACPEPDFLVAAHRVFAAPPILAWASSESFRFCHAAVVVAG